MSAKFRPNSIFIFLSGGIVIVLLGLLLYYNAMKRELADSSCETIGELIEQQKLTFFSQIEGELAVVQTLASLFPLQDIHNENALLSFLETAVKESRFSSLSFSKLSGETITSSDEKINLADTAYFKEALTGKTVISQPFISEPEGKTLIEIAAPVFSEEKIIGVLSGGYITEDLTDLFFSSFAGNGYAYITDKKGGVIARAGGQRNGVKENILTYLESAQIIQYDSPKIIVQKMEAGEGGHTAYQSSTQKRLLHYQPVGLNGWYIFTTVPDEEVSSQGNYLMSLTVLLTLGILTVLGIFLSYFYISGKNYEALLYKKAFYNSLTNAPNLIKFREEAQDILKKYPNVPYGILRISIENLDFFNEIYSHAVGDNIIKAVAETYSQLCKPNKECFGHIYGDRFIALFMADSFKVLEAKQQEFEKILQGKISGLVNYKLTFSVGIYLIDDEKEIFSIVEKVNFAHHTAKKNDLREGKIQKYDSKLKDALHLEREVESKMEKALANREFTMFLQPKFRLADNTLEGAEALARWWIQGTYIMYPSDFIPIFEKNGFVVHLDMYMFEEACRFLRQLIDDGKAPIVISTNFSRLHLLRENFVSKLNHIADKYRIPHKYLEIEITESSMVGNEALLLEVLDHLHKSGFTLSMDDFGSGYSSLGLLKEIPIDVVKIDRSFFEHSKKRQREQIVISSVIDMALKLNIRTVAEGVETQEHIDFLKELGCEIVQGYYYSKPMPFNEFYKTFL